MLLFLVITVLFCCTDDDVFDVVIVQNIEELLNTSSVHIGDVFTQAIEHNIACGIGGGLADVTGQKVWCWENISIPEFKNKKGASVSNKQLSIDSECYEKQVAIVGNRLRFNINPTTPNTDKSWCQRDFNMRAEIRTAPWNIRHPLGTEEWFGWSYTFGENYIIDQNNQWLFFQVHHGVVGDSPHTELMVIKEGQFEGHNAGEIFVVNNANYPDYHPTGIIPKAGETLDIVVHTIWGNATNGLLQVWINGKSLYDRQVATVYAAHPWGGNAKWGIYKWPWKKESNVKNSLQQGITNLETYMGTLRIITREPSDVDYLSDACALVAPD